VRDVELYARLLGLEDPWFVDDVELSIEKRQVEVFVAHHEGRLWGCPSCQAQLPINDHFEERAWRHLDTGGVPDLSASTAAARQMPRARGAPGAPAVGRAQEPAHQGLRALRHRRHEGDRREGRGQHLALVKSTRSCKSPSGHGPQAATDLVDVRRRRAA
jgi:hypothetical protein